LLEFLSVKKGAPPLNLEMLGYHTYTEMKGRTPDVYYSPRRAIFLGRTIKNVTQRYVRSCFWNVGHHSFLESGIEKSFYGKPTELNYAPMLTSLFVRIMEPIPNIKDLVKRLNRSVEFRYAM